MSETGEARIMSLGVAVDDPPFVALLRSRLQTLLGLTRNVDM